ncbi:MAG: transcription elongation factor GreAB [Verrucomicrobiae bacterium]|nr:transcription elongation factor GreAB [Verrucomicrobiae bacterium]
MNKAAVLRKIVECLTSDLELYLKAARAAHFEATHEQSKAENKYDTRGLEASYLARGQSRQAAELELAVQQFQRLSGSSWPDGRPADIGALVELRSRRQSQWYFLGPGAGGTEVEEDGHEVTVITPQSPLGRQLVGHRTGDAVQPLSEGKAAWTIHAIF